VTHYFITKVNGVLHQVNNIPTLDLLRSQLAVIRFEAEKVPSPKTVSSANISARRPFGFFLQQPVFNHGHYWASF
jgi:hypothetical protein